MENQKIWNETSGKQDDSVTDVYSLIRSAEIRDYYRREDILGIFEKEALILHSYISVQRKAAMLKQLSETGNEEEKSKIGEMYRVYSKYIDMICHPQVRTLFLLESNKWRWEGDEMYCDTCGLDGAYDTLEEVMEYTEMYQEEGPSISMDVTVLHVPQDTKVREVFQFTIFWIDGTWEIRDFIIASEELERQGISEDTIDRYLYFGLYHPLPFENGSRLKLKLPFMEEPVYGILESELDGNGCWYHFLYSEGESSEILGDMTRVEIDDISGYSSFDWIERA
ncbi:MAG: hypothetical protein NC416_13145 [Eubacterium sp.]|nr:hypothetical protein [Eubacterium sp.]